ncbi:secreted protein, partial [mine drainage metagenome]
MRHATRFRVALAVVAAVMLAPAARAVPSFSRQTGMACAACHTVFPELTPFGREFKANGYVLDNLRQVRAVSSTRQQLLSLSQLPTL